MSIKNNYFEIFCLGVLIIAFLGWVLEPFICMSILVLIAAGMLIKTKDAKYVLPILMSFAFINNRTFKMQSTPVMLIITGVFLLIVLLVFLFKNGFSLSLGKSKLGLALLAISSLIPILWNETAQGGNEYFYFLYFNWVGYFLIYIFIVNVIKRDVAYDFSIAMCYLGLLISLECGFCVYEIIKTGGSLNEIYYLGWGMCNEAGIMLCMVLPFAFYCVMKKFKTRSMIWAIFRLIFICIGILLTFSRGTYLFAFIEALIFGIMFLTSFGIKKKYIYCTLILIGISIIGGLIMKPNLFARLFTAVFDDNGRIALYHKAIEVFSSTPKTVIFGGGIACLVDPFDRLIVFHSTIYETLGKLGLFGCFALIIHLAQKYYAVIKSKGLFTSIMLVGYFIVDLYGLIDNTYHMYYYSIILVICMGIIESHNEYPKEVTQYEA